MLLISDSQHGVCFTWCADILNGMFCGLLPLVLCSHAPVLFVSQ